MVLSFGNLSFDNLSFDNLSFDIAARETKVASASVPLSRRESDLLEHLMRRAGRVVSKRFLEETLYGFDDEVASNTIEATVSRLRKRLQSSSPACPKRCASASSNASGGRTAAPPVLVSGSPSSGG